MGRARAEKESRGPLYFPFIVPPSSGLTNRRSRGGKTKRKNNKDGARVVDTGLRGLEGRDGLEQMRDDGVGGDALALRGEVGRDAVA